MQRKPHIEIYSMNTMQHCQTIVKFKAGFSIDFIKIPKILYILNYIIRKNHKQVGAAGNNRIVILDLNKSENNINTTDISGKSSFLQSKKSLKDYELVN